MFDLSNLNLVKNADPHQAFSQRTWKTTLESTRAQSAFNGLMSRFKKGVWFQTWMAEICRTQNPHHSKSTSVCELHHEGLQFECVMVLRKMFPKATHPKEHFRLSPGTMNEANVILRHKQWQQLQDRNLNDMGGNAIPTLFRTG